MTRRLGASASCEREPGAGRANAREPWIERLGTLSITRRRTSWSNGERSAPRSAAPRGFTLTELLVVIVIIGIILSLILTVAMEGIRRAEERATQSLITKLEIGLSDRLDSLMQTLPEPSPAHLILGGIYSSQLGAPVTSNDRASVIAAYDYIKREMPDVFFVQDPSLSSNYPINFAATPYPTNIGGDADYVLPLGQANFDSGVGIYGASFYTAAGLYKNLGYPAQACDGIDNDADGYIDNTSEVRLYGGNVDEISARLANHKHKTARSEMLYALLVEGTGPLGSVFTRDEFTDAEVRDTDGDGLPEFVDAWGEPLQFYRWPILYHSDLQKGQVLDNTSEQVQVLVPPYGAVWDEREQNPLDPNQQLVAPSWWYGTNPSGLPGNDTAPLTLPTGPVPQGASWASVAFARYFHRLSEPLQVTNAALMWDRSGSYRRSFYSKFLVVSSGPDKRLGLFQYSDSRLQALGNNRAAGLISNENSAMPFAVVDFSQNAYMPSGSTIAPPDPYVPPNEEEPSSYDIQQYSRDDITNHALQLSVGGS